MIKPLSAKWAFVVLGCSAALLSVFGGCNQIAGIEERTNLGQGGDGPDPGQRAVTDETTSITTTVQCIEYCDLLEENCNDDDDFDHRVYPSRDACLNTCNALPPGKEGDRDENSVACRIVFAQNAKSIPDESCPAAGPGSIPAGGCGTPCENWCQLLEAECPAAHEGLNDCERACETIPTIRRFDIDEVGEGDTLQCRLLHLGEVGGDPESESCASARYIPTAQCVAPEGDVPTCDEYCRLAQTNCPGDNAGYETEQDCEAACVAFPDGEFADRNVNTKGCRIYHAKAAATGEVPHCNHMGPYGAGQCGAYEAQDDITGPCESYCMLLQQGCEDIFVVSFDDLQDCAETCKDDFEGRGAEEGGTYQVAVATEEDSLQCRVHYAVKAMAALAEDETVAAGAACLKASPRGICD